MASINRTIYPQLSEPKDAIEWRARLVAELTQAAQTMNSTANLINVGVEWLIKERWELPAFSTLDRIAGHIKQSVNDALFDKV